MACLGAAALVAAAVASGSSAGAADADTPVLLGTTEDFAVLAGGGITNTGATVIANGGFVGSFPTTSQTGFETLTTVPPDPDFNQMGNEVTQLAKDNLVTAYNDAAGAGPTTDVGTELGGQTLTKGVYGDTDGNGVLAGPLNLTGALTLDGGRSDGTPSDSVFIFQSPTTLITAVDSSVVLTGGAQACNVFWQVGSAATFNTRTSFQGTVMANTEAITAGQGATFVGRLLARTAAITLNNNTITAPDCEPGGAADGSVEADADGTDDDGTDTDGADDTDGTDTDGTDTDGTDDADGAVADGDGGLGDDTDTDGVSGADADGGSAGDADGTDADGGGDADTDGGTSTSASPPDSWLPSAGGPSAVLLTLAGLAALGGALMLVVRRRFPRQH